VACRFTWPKNSLVLGFTICVFSVRRTNVVKITSAVKRRVVVLIFHPPRSAVHGNLMVLNAYAIKPYGFSFLDYAAFTGPHRRMTEMKASSRTKTEELCTGQRCLSKIGARLPPGSPTPTERLRPNHGNFPTQETGTPWSEVN
jgi:hypothetical protein